MDKPAPSMIRPEAPEAGMDDEQLRRHGGNRTSGGQEGDGSKDKGGHRAYYEELYAVGQVIALIGAMVPLAFMLMR